MRFTSGMSEDELIKRFDKFHEKITGNYFYEGGDEWYQFRIGLILACHRVLIDDDGWKEKMKMNEFEKDYEKTLKKLGVLAGVGEDWFTVGDEEKDESGAVRYGVYAKDEDIAVKVGAVLDRMVAEKGKE